MDDVLEYSAAGAAKYAPQLLPLLLAGAADRDANIRQVLEVATAVWQQAQQPGIHTLISFFSRLPSNF